MTNTLASQLITHRAGAAIGQLLRSETVNGVTYLVAPIISAREGVMNGVLYLADELQRSAPAWDGVPAPLGHPTGPLGEFVSATVEASPGVIYNSRWDAATASLKHEIWIDLNRAGQLGGGALTLLARLNSGQVIDVSTGLYADVEAEEGEWNGQRYWGIARNITPDHIAILLNEPGACSARDGCGVPLLNRQELGMEKRMMVQMELTLDEQQEAALRAFWEREAPGRLQDVFADRLVYRQDGRLWMVAFTLAEDGKAELGEAVEVEYRPVAAAAAPEIMSNAQQPTWLDALKQFISNQFRQEAKPMDRPTVIQTLLANERNTLSQETLNALSDAELTGYAAQVQPCRQAQANAAQPVADARFEELLAEFRSLKAQLVANSDAEKAGLIAQIVANTDVFTQAELSGKPLAEVQKLHRLTVPADYSGQGLPVANAASEWEPYVSPVQEAK